MIYIVVAAYNEEKAIGTFFENIKKTLQNIGEPWQLIIVDDGSKDRTKEIIKLYSQKMPILFISHEINKGVGMAFKTGLEKACSFISNGDIVITIEADDTNEAKIIKDMVMAIGSGYELVCASRYRKGGGYYKMPFIRYLVSRGVNILFQILIPIKGIRDYSIFFRAYRGSLLKKIHLKYKNKLIESKGFTWNIELLLKTLSFSFLATEVPLLYRYDLKRSKSKMRPCKTIIEYLYLILKIFLKGKRL